MIYLLALLAFSASWGAPKLNRFDSREAKISVTVPDTLKPRELRDIRVRNRTVRAWAWVRETDKKLPFVWNEKVINLQKENLRVVSYDGNKLVVRGNIWKPFVDQVVVDTSIPPLVIKGMLGQETSSDGTVWSVAVRPAHLDEVVWQAEFSVMVQGQKEFLSSKLSYHWNINSAVEPTADTWEWKNFRFQVEPRLEGVLRIEGGKIVLQKWSFNGRAGWQGMGVFEVASQTDIQGEMGPMASKPINIPLKPELNLVLTQEGMMHVSILPTQNLKSSSASKLRIEIPLSEKVEWSQKLPAIESGLIAMDKLPKTELIYPSLSGEASLELNQENAWSLMLGSDTLMQWGTRTEWKHRQQQHPLFGISVERSSQSYFWQVDEGNPSDTSALDTSIEASVNLVREKNKTKAIVARSTALVSGPPTEPIYAVPADIQPHQIKLVWRFIAGSERYWIQQKESESWKPLGFTSQNSWDINSLQADSLYTFRLLPLNEWGVGKAETLYVRTLPMSKPKVVEDTVKPLDVPIGKTGKERGEAVVFKTDTIVSIEKNNSATPRKSAEFSDGWVSIPSGKYIRSDGTEIRLSSFNIQATEVTQKDYQKHTGKNPSFRRGSNLPVENVSWFDASTYCSDLGGSLPTEAQWEYAARGNSVSEFYWGDKSPDIHAWFHRNAENQSRPVAQKLANGFGLYDMSGNVFEWTSTWYADYAKGRGALNNPQGPSTGTARVTRGGSWFSDAASLKVSSRFSNRPNFSNYKLGFRCVKNN